VITRREFGALLAVPAPPIRAAMIGAGHGHANSKAKALTSMAEYSFAGYAVPEPEDGVRGEIFPSLRRVTVDSILRDASIEMVALEFADPDTNLKFAHMAIDAGKWLHLDKPPGGSYSGLRSLLRNAAGRQRIVQMGYQWRYHAGMNAVLEAARGGKLGRVYRFRASIDKLIGVAERRDLAKYKGGMMFSEGCHLVDRATALLGEPRSVRGFLRHDGTVDDGLRDNNLVVMEYANALAEISLAGFDSNGAPHRYVEVWGTEGIGRAQPYAPAQVHFHLKGEKPHSFEPPPVPTYTPDFAELARVIRNGEKPSYTADHDLMTHRVLLEACGMLEGKQG